MLIDLRRCTSCKACTASCVAEQKSPPGIMYRPIYEEEFGVFPKVKDVLPRDSATSATTLPA